MSDVPATMPAAEGGAELIAGINRSALMLLYDKGSAQGGSNASTSRIDICKTIIADREIVEEASRILLESLHTKFDLETLELLSQSLIRLGKFSKLTECVERAPPGALPRPVRWRYLALSQHLAGNDGVALDLLRKTLHPNEGPNDIPALILASQICSNSPTTADEGIRYAFRASEASNEDRCQALHVLALNKGMKARGEGVSGTQASALRLEAIACLEEVMALRDTGWARAAAFDLAVLLSEEGSYNRALKLVKGVLEEEECGDDKWQAGGSGGEGARFRWHAKKGDRWRLLALILSGQRRGKEAEEICRAAVAGGGVGGEREQQALLRVLGKIQLVAGAGKEALETAKWRLKMLQRVRKDAAADQVQISCLEEHVWEDMVEVYTALGQLDDAATCAKNALDLGPYSPEAWHAQGLVEEARGNVDNAMSYFGTAIAMDPNFAPTKIKLAAQFQRGGGESALALSRTLSSQAAQTNPTDSRCWLQLGLVNEAKGRTEDSVQCFHTAVSLARVAPVASFRSILWSVA